MNEPINTVSLKDVSLVIATYNEEECIKYVLDELQQFDLGEIIIVDGNSTDNTKTIAETYNVKFISQSKNGWGSAVKEGINLSSKTPNSPSHPWPCFETCVAAVVIIPKPPLARLESQLISSIEIVPSSKLCLFVIAARTIRFFEWTPDLLNKKFEFRLNIIIFDMK